MLLLRVTLRIPWLASVAFFALLTAAFAVVGAYDAALPWTTGAVLAFGMMIVLTRIGLVAMIVGHLVLTLLKTNPITSDLTAWYAPAGNFAVALVGLLLAWGFYTALARGSGRLSGAK